MRRPVFTLMVIAVLAAIVATAVSAGPEVSVTGQAFAHYGGPGDPWDAWVPLFRFNTPTSYFARDPDKLLYASLVDESSIRLGSKQSAPGPEDVGAYIGYGQAFLSADVSAFDFYVSAVPGTPSGSSRLRLELWWLEEIVWSSVAPWSTEPQHVQLDVPRYGGYQFRLAIVPEPATWLGMITPLIVLILRRRS